MRGSRRSLCCVALACASCTTGTPDVVDKTGAPDVGVPTRSIDLTCADSGTGTAPSSASTRRLAVGGLVVEDFGGHPVAVPRAADVGISLAPGSTLRFRKAPVYVRAGSSPVVVELSSPSAGGALGWVPARVWAGSSAPELAPWLARRVTFLGCPDRDSTYFGGLLAADPRACLALTLRQQGGPVRPARLRLDGVPC